MKIAVTGASGFIGGAVATSLAEGGHEVVGFGRRPAGWDHPNARYQQWDLTAPPPPIDLDFDGVVHAAALADDWAPLSLALAVNRDGTRAVTRAFRHVRIVHLSTSSVYDPFSPSVRVTESEPPARRFLSAYSESKAAAELELSGSDCVILRPHAVYGSDDTTLLPRLLAGISGSRLRLPEGGQVLHSLTSIGNLVDAVSLALAPGAPRGIFNISDDHPVLLSLALGDILARRGRGDVSLRRVPYARAFRAAALAESVSRSRGTRPRFTRYAVSQLGLERTLDITRARNELGFSPGPTDFDGAETW
jgi:nucleoside-diphosphate-sugar epimerase